MEPDVKVSDVQPNDPTVRTINGTEFIHYGNALIDRTSCGVMVSNSGVAYAVILGKIFYTWREDRFHYEILSEVTAPTWEKMLTFLSHRVVTWHLDGHIYGAMNDAEKVFLQAFNSMQRGKKLNTVDIYLPANTFEDGTHIAYYLMMLRQEMETGTITFPDNSRIKVELANMSEDAIYKDDCRDHPLIAAIGFALEHGKGLGSMNKKFQKVIGKTTGKYVDVSNFKRRR
jgi:hypothetical protein